jgi:hypothetical protein
MGNSSTRQFCLKARRPLEVYWLIQLMKTFQYYYLMTIVTLNFEKNLLIPVAHNHGNDLPFYMHIGMLNPNSKGPTFKSTNPKLVSVLHGVLHRERKKELPHQRCDRVLWCCGTQNDLIMKQFDTL